MSLLEVENLSQKFELQENLKQVCFSLNQAERLVLLGESGSGKSSLLNCIAGFLQPSEARSVCVGRSCRAHSLC
jgi:ABC-type Fe3+/spermidine/putrescine transport system ATPase subunit